MKLCKVLAVIDDTDNEKQLEQLLPHCPLHAESLLIITSRKNVIFTKRGIAVSKVQLLSEGQDAQLFKAWAFSAGLPAWDTSELVQEVVACCGGLPLTLKVAVACARNKHATASLCLSI